MTLKSDDQSSQKWPAKVRSSTAFLHNNGFGLENLQHKPSLNLPPWPQEVLFYIDLMLVTISQLPPKIWPKKGPNIPQYWPKISKIAPKIIKNHYYMVKKTTSAYIWVQPLYLHTPGQWEPPCGQALKVCVLPPLVNSAPSPVHRTMWPRAITPCARILG
jgi:hypothetical protein